ARRGRRASADQLGVEPRHRAPRPARLRRAARRSLGQRARTATRLAPPPGPREAGDAPLQDPPARGALDPGSAGRCDAQGRLPGRAVGDAHGAPDRHVVAAGESVTGTNRMRPIGIFGGTFDPIHYGHLRTALELQQTLDFERVHFVPVATPPHQKIPISDGALRMRLVEAAIEGEPQFVADPRELERQGPSYTIDTLASFRKEFPQQPLCLLIGMD